MTGLRTVHFPAFLLYFAEEVYILCLQGKNIALLLTICIFPALHGCTNYFMLRILGAVDSGFISVTGIDVVEKIPCGQELPLNQIGKTIPANATCRDIKWTVIDDGGGGGWTIDGAFLKPPVQDLITEIVLQATISGGAAKGEDFTDTYRIVIDTGGSYAPWLVYDDVTLNKIGKEADWTTSGKYLQIDNISWPDSKYFIPIGSPYSQFTGSYTVKTYKNSNNREFYYSINGLIIVEPSTVNTGMFASIGGPGSGAEGVTLVNCNINGDDSVGGIAGYNGGRIISCTVSGTVSGTKFVGGIAGNNGYELIDCHNSADISGPENSIGGIAGINYGIIQSCDSTGSVSGDENIGGVAGENNSGSIIDCRFDGMIICGAASKVGGVTGENADGGQISNCRVTAGITGNMDVGGIAGSNSGAFSHINACHAGNSVISGNFRAGGIAGSNHNSASLLDCSFTGSIPGTGISIGGIAGRNYDAGMIDNCFSTGDIEGSECVGAVVGDISGGGEVRTCYAGGRVMGQKDIGGIAGSIDNGTVRYCYFTGDAGNIYSLNAGGVAGNNNGTVIYCYAASGSVSGQENIGGIAGCNTGILEGCMALTENIQSDPGYGGLYIGRISGVADTAEAGVLLQDNYGYAGMKKNGVVTASTWPDNVPDGLDGGDLDYNSIMDFGSELAHFKTPPWNYTPGSLPGLFGETVPMPVYIRY